MYLHMIAVGDASAVFFVMLQIFGKYVLLNLFLAILLENFEEIEIKEEALREETSVDTVASTEMTSMTQGRKKARKERGMWAIVKYGFARCLKALGFRRSPQVASVLNDPNLLQPAGGDSLG